MRIARPSTSLARAERFWCDGVGLEVLWRSPADVQGGHPLLMVGLPGAQWHLELVEDPEALRSNPPGPEDLLVIYLGRNLDDAEIERIELAGGRRVTSRNPYWDDGGLTFLDDDGYRLVLTSRAWPARADPKFTVQDY